MTHDVSLVESGLDVGIRTPIHNQLVMRDMDLSGAHPADFLVVTIQEYGEISKLETFLGDGLKKFLVPVKVGEISDVRSHRIAHMLDFSILVDGGMRVKSDGDMIRVRASVKDGDAHLLADVFRRANWSGKCVGARDGGLGDADDMRGSRRRRFWDLFGIPVEIAIEIHFVRQRAMFPCPDPDLGHGLGRDGNSMRFSGGCHDEPNLGIRWGK
jgi:hypothetical protein